MRRLLARPRERVLVALFVAAVFAIGWAPAADGDLFWHLAAGREMVTTRALLRTDPFSVSAAGRPWVDVHWLFQLGLYALHVLGGLAALVIAKCLVLASAASLLLWLVVRRAGSGALVPFMIVFLGALFAVRELLLVRPVIVTLLFLSLFLGVLERFRSGASEKSLLVLPAGALLWANVQGLFALGAGLVVLYALAFTLSAWFGGRAWFPFARESGSAERDRASARWLWLSAGACVVASLVTPYGVAALELPFRLLARLSPQAANAFSANVAENVPPFAFGHSVAAQFFHLKGFFLLLLVSFIVPPRRLLLSQIFVLAAFLVLGLAANRNVLLLYWVATPLLVLKFMPFLRLLQQKSRAYRGPLWARRAGYLALLAIFGLVGTAAAKETSVAEPTPFRAPTESARWIAERADPRPVFSADNYGGYLIWKLHPRNKPYLDTRLILRTPAEFQEYLGVVDEPERFDAFERRYDFGYVVLPTEYPDRYLSLIAHLYASPRWKLVFTDGTETLFARRDSAAASAWDLDASDTTERVLSALSARFGTSGALVAAARLQFARLDLVVGALDQAERVLETTTGPDAEALRARSLLARGDVPGAEKIARRLLSEFPEKPSIINILAQSAFADGRRDDATRLLRQVLSDDPFDPEAQGLLRRMEERPNVEQH